MNENNIASQANFIAQISSFLRTSDLVNGYKELKDDIDKGLEILGDNILTTMRSIPSKIKSLPGNIFDGIKEIYGTIKDSIKSSYSKLKEHVKTRLGVPPPPPPPPAPVRRYDDIQSNINRVQNTLNRSTDPSGIANLRSQLTALQNEARNHPSQITANGPDLPTIGSGGSASGGDGKKGGGFSINGMLGAFGLPGVGAMIGSALKDGAIAAISGSIQKEQDVLGLSNVLGKGQDANAAYKGIRSDAEASSFDTSTLLEANKSLLSVGSGAQQARQDVMNLANAVTATGGGKDQLLKLSDQMKEIKSSGKASGDQLKEFESAGIDVFGMLSASTGKSVAELQKQGVDYAALSQSLGQARGQGGMYEDALGKQNNTITGKWDMIKEKGANALTDIGDSFTPIISKVLDIGVQFANSFAPAIQLVQPYIDIIANGLGQAVEFITGLGEGTNAWGGFVTTIQEYFSIVWNTLGSVFGAVWSIISGIIEWISKSVLISDIFTGVYKVLGVVLTMVGWLADGIKIIWENVLRPILDAIETAYRWVRKIVGGEEVAIEPKVKVVPPKDFTKDFKAQEAAFDFKKSNGMDLTSKSRPTAIGQGESMRTNNAAKSRETGETVSGGGQKTINITLGKFFDTIQFNTLNSGETSDQLESIVMECLGRVLYNGAKVM